MQGKYKIWLLAFAILGILNLAAEFFHQQVLVFLTKPLLLTILSIYFYQHTKSVSSSFRNLMLAGFLFSVAGDSFLMFVESNPQQQIFFLLGLGSFLITHLCYGIAFYRFPSTARGWVARHPWILLVFLTYLIGNSLFLWSALPVPLRLPVIVYSSCIMLMTVTALNLAGKIPKAIFQILFLGVLLFVFSDTMIGLHKFKSATITLPYPRLLIMIPYLLGQYFIVRAAIQMNNS
ncbi:MAG: lysoplasmalogenase [Saprospiraceae bacterium]